MHQRKNFGREDRLLDEVGIASDRVSDRQQGVVKEEPRHQSTDEPENEGDTTGPLRLEAENENKIKNDDDGKGVSKRPQRSAQSARVSALQIAQSQGADHGP